MWIVAKIKSSDKISIKKELKNRINKMLAFMIAPNTTTSVIDLIGLELEKNDNDNYDVVNLNYMGAGEKKGIQFYDEVTRIEISTLDRPKKEYIYLFGLLVLILTIFSQYKKLKK